MTKKTLTVGLVLAALAAAGVMLIAPWASQVDALDRAMARVMAEGAETAVLVVQVEDATEVRSYGALDGAQMHATTRVRLASLTKPVTSAAILALVGEGVLSLEDTVPDLLAEITFADPLARTMTLRDLLRHSAGVDAGAEPWPLFNPADTLAEVYGIDASAQQDCRAIAEAVAARPLTAPPGTAYAYSNTGYCLLGLILEAKTGTPLEAALHALVPEAAGLSFDLTTLELEGQTAPPERAYLALRPTVVGAAGGLIGSALDYMAFLERPVAEQVVEQPPYYDGAPSFMGLGWRVWPQEGCPARTHFGAMPGVFSVALVGEDGARFVALFSARPADDGKAFIALVEAACAHFAQAAP